MSDEKEKVDDRMEADVNSGNHSADEAREADPIEAAGEAQAAVDVESELEQWKRAAEENQNRALRALADMENMRRRFRKEQEDLQKYASVSLVEEMLPVLDNFERALSVDKENLTVESLMQGIDMVYRQMVQILEKDGLRAIEATGKPFDPHVHQAVMQVEDSAFESGVVVEELQKGYQYKDRTIRPSMVKVNA